MKHNIQYINSLRLQNRIFKVLVFMALVGGFLYIIRDRVVSPCPDQGCGVQQIFADEPTMTVKEKLYFYGIRAFGVEHVEALSKLVFKESGFNPYAVNKTSGAGGLFQALPFSKTGCKLSEVDCQIRWGLGYIKSRYGTPSNAWAFHQTHNWY